MLLLMYIKQVLVYVMRYNPWPVHMNVVLDIYVSVILHLKFHGVSVPLLSVV